MTDGLGLTGSDITENPSDDREGFALSRGGPGGVDPETARRINEARRAQNLAQAVTICPAVGRGFDVVTADEFFNLQRLSTKHLISPTRLQLRDLTQNFGVYRLPDGRLEFPEAGFGNYYVFCSKINTPQVIPGNWNVEMGSPVIEGSVGLQLGAGFSLQTYGKETYRNIQLLANVKTTRSGNFFKETGLVARHNDRTYYAGVMRLLPDQRNLLRILKVVNGKDTVLAERVVAANPLFRNSFQVRTVGGFGRESELIRVEEQRENQGAMEFRVTDNQLFLSITSVTGGGTTQLTATDPNPLPAGQAGTHRPSLPPNLREIDFPTFSLVNWRVFSLMLLNSLVVSKSLQLTSMVTARPRSLQVLALVVGRTSKFSPDPRVRSSMDFLPLAHPIPSVFFLQQAISIMMALQTYWFPAVEIPGSTSMMARD